MGSSDTFDKLSLTILLMMIFLIPGLSQDIEPVNTIILPIEENHDCQIGGVLMTRDNTKLIIQYSVGHDFYADSKIFINSLNTGGVLKEISISPGFYHSYSFSPDQKYLAGAGSYLMIIDFENTYKQYKFGYQGNYDNQYYSFDGNRLIYKDYNNYYILKDLNQLWWRNPGINDISSHLDKKPLKDHNDMILAFTEWPVFLSRTGFDWRSDAIKLYYLKDDQDYIFNDVIYESTVLKNSALKFYPNLNLILVAEGSTIKFIDAEKKEIIYSAVVGNAITYMDANYERKFILVRNKNGNSISTDLFLYPSLYNVNCPGINFNNLLISDDGNQLITWSNNEIKIYKLDHFLANLFYKNEIENELKGSELNLPKGEFETQSLFDARLKRYGEFKKEIYDKYGEKASTFINDQAEKKIQTIKESYGSESLAITDVGTYDADHGILPLTIEKVGLINLPVPVSEAKSFKENCATLRFNAEKQLEFDEKTTRYFNLQVVHPITGAVYVIKSGHPYFVDYVASKTRQISGIPNLVPEIKFIEPSGNDLLDGGESARFEIILTNNGDGTAKDITVHLTDNLISGLSYEKEIFIPGIVAGEKYLTTIEIEANRKIPDSVVQFTFDFNESNGFMPGSVNFIINTQHYKNPVLKLQDVIVHEATGNGNNIIENGENIEVTVLVQNRGQGDALESKALVSFSDPNILILTPDKLNQSFGDLKPGESRQFSFNFSVNYNYSGTDSLPINLVLSERYNEYGGKFPMGLELKKKNLAKTTIELEGKYQKDIDIQEVSLLSDVDKNIPVNDQLNVNRFALVIGNEDYSSYQKGLDKESDVDFARNDATVFARYCQLTLGIPEENIILITDASSPQMNSSIEKLCKLAQYSNGEAELIFYYAGHGFPDEETKEGYIMPVDITGANVKYGIKLSDLYYKLTEYPAKRVVVILDACFSGGARNESLLSVRGVKVKAKSTPLRGNLIAITASSGDQSSLSFKEKQHGMFTYFLLKKLQEGSKSISYKALTEYIIYHVQLESVKINNQEQNPQVLISPEIENEWINWMVE